jgi:hypothetical protein
MYAMKVLREAYMEVHSEFFPILPPNTQQREHEADAIQVPNTRQSVGEQEGNTIQGNDEGDYDPNNWGRWSLGIGEGGGAVIAEVINGTLVLNNTLSSRQRHDFQSRLFSTIVRGFAYPTDNWPEQILLDCNRPPLYLQGPPLYNIGDGVYKTTRFAPDRSHEDNFHVRNLLVEPYGMVSIRCVNGRLEYFNAESNRRYEVPENIAGIQDHLFSVHQIPGYRHERGGLPRRVQFFADQPVFFNNGREEGFFTGVIAVIRHDRETRQGFFDHGYLTGVDPGTGETSILQRSSPNQDAQGITDGQPGLPARYPTWLTPAQMLAILQRGTPGQTYGPEIRDLFQGDSQARSQEQQDSGETTPETH